MLCFCNDDNQILHVDQSRWEENFYRIDHSSCPSQKKRIWHECWRAIFLCYYVATISKNCAANVGTFAGVKVISFCQLDVRLAQFSYFVNADSEWTGNWRDARQRLARYAGLHPYWERRLPPRISNVQVYLALVPLPPPIQCSYDWRSRYRHRRVLDAGALRRLKVRWIQLMALLCWLRSAGRKLCIPHLLRHLRALKFFVDTAAAWAVYCLEIAQHSMFQFLTKQFRFCVRSHRQGETGAK